MILNNILEKKRLEVKRLLVEQTEKVVSKKVERPSLVETIQQSNHLQVIAEIKRASPSKGTITQQVNPIEQAKKYRAAGAACISVLTDTPFFNGSFQDLTDIANVVDLPILCKDFIIHEVQVDRAKAAGASVILLIVAALDETTFQRLYRYAIQQGMEVLVEVHTIDELSRALFVEPSLIGVNNRDLRTFTVDLAKTDEIAKALPSRQDCVLISESGIWTSGDAQQVARSGAQAVLVGEALMRSEHVEQTIQSLQVPLLEVRV